MPRMFSDYYNFDFNAPFYNINKVTIAEQNREHKHKDIKEGIESYSHNNECIASNSERRRGSDKLYLVNDKYYVWSSRTGMETSGNCVQFSSNSPQELQFEVLQSVFRNLLSRRFNTIKKGVRKEDLLDTGLSITSARNFLIEKELNESEKEQYFENVADLTVELIQKFHEANSINQLADAANWYKDSKQELFDEIRDVEPTALSKFLKNRDFSKSEWTYPSKVRDSVSYALLQNESFYDTNQKAYCLSVREHRNTDKQNTINVFESDLSTSETREITQETYTNLNELTNILEKYMATHPDNFENHESLTKH